MHKTEKSEKGRFREKVHVSQRDVRLDPLHDLVPREEPSTYVSEGRGPPQAKKGRGSKGRG